MREFRVWAPRAGRVDLVIGERRFAMQALERGWWQTEAPDEEAASGYRYSLDGGASLPDPRSQWQREGVHGASYLVDHAAYTWLHDDFRAGPIAAGIVYELHIGTFTPEGTYTAAVEKLDHLVSLGVTHVEIMPIAEFPGMRGWGYDGVDLYAPHRAYGTPDELKAFIDACHGKGLAVLLDVVYNHLGPDGNYLDRFGPYFTSSYQTPWGSAVNLDQEGSTEVRRFFIDNAMMWLRDYHFDGLRLDAVHSLGDRSAIHFLEQLAAEVEGLSLSLDRELSLVAESDLNDPRLVWSRERGGYQLHATWSDDFHHAVHTVLSGEDNGYYADFGRIADVAKALTAVYVYDSRYSEARVRNHGRPIGELSPRRFVVASQNHDQVGNRAQGERLEHLIGPEKAKIAAALTLLAPSVPMLFQGEEWAASSPFQYFTDHESPELAKAVSEGRRREFVQFGWRPDEVPDPQDPSTFERSHLDWQELDEAPHFEMIEWYRTLTAYRRTHSQYLAVPPSEVRVDEEARTLVIVRGSLTLAVNFSDTAFSLDLRADPSDLLCSKPVDLTGDGMLIPPQTLVCFLV
ncbi:MAG: malto-oligosyltrehalose trehalohydrolase [Dehalococcoidia bacterium]